MKKRLNLLHIHGEVKGEEERATFLETRKAPKSLEYGEINANTSNVVVPTAVNLSSFCLYTWPVGTPL